MNRSGSANSDITRRVSMSDESWRMVCLGLIVLGVFLCLGFVRMLRDDLSWWDRGMVRAGSIAADVMLLASGVTLIVVGAIGLLN